MKHYTSSLGLTQIALLGLMTGCASRCHSDTLVETGDPPHIEYDTTFGAAERVVVLVMDGTRIEESLARIETLDKDYSDAAEGSVSDILPEIRASLLGQGTNITPGYVTDVTLTSPAHVTFFTGTRRPYGTAPIQDADDAQYRPELPTLFELVRSARGVDGDKTIILSNTVHLLDLHQSLYPDTRDLPGDNIFVTGANGEAPSTDDTELLDLTQEHLEDGAELIVVNLHQIDRVGHNSPAGYASAATLVDSPIVALWEWIQQPDGSLRDHTVLAIVADHGRNRTGDLSTPWKGHGDDCTGCREIPLFLVGAGIKQGGILETPHTLEDVSRTLAWLMGVEHPYATGLIISDALTDETPPPQLSGPAQVHTSGDLVAYHRWRDDPNVRSEIVVDGEVLSGADAFQIEAPRVLQGPDADYVCWREIVIRTSEERWPWEARCQVRTTGGSWTDIGFAEPRVIPTFRPDLALDDEGRLVIGYAAFNEDYDPAASSAKATIPRLIRWSEGADWEVIVDPDYTGYYPIHASTVIDGATTWVAVSRGADESNSRYTRNIEINRFRWSNPDSQDWTTEAVTATTNDGGTYRRHEHPAMMMLDGALHLAFHGYDEEGIALLVMEGNPEAQSWSAPVALDEGRVLSHISPVWSVDGVLSWARLSASSTVEVCSASAGSTDVTCVDTTYSYIESIAPAPGGGVLAVLSAGANSWELITVE
ncbi:MAG: hypothetical protein ACI8S6_002598 [Myxococcota bacterium]